MDRRIEVSHVACRVEELYIDFWYEEVGKVFGISVEGFPT